MDADVRVPLHPSTKLGIEQLGPYLFVYLNHTGLAGGSHDNRRQCVMPWDGQRGPGGEFRKFKACFLLSPICSRRMDLGTRCGRLLHSISGCWPMGFQNFYYTEYTYWRGVNHQRGQKLNRAVRQIQGNERPGRLRMESIDG
ncbi:hypothetical protein DFH09DRAFT_1073108 [Mycena vulgaris]|nr:hypothetical protein DFH09DRAFT_1073108 [Mycena vulgaris]